MSDRWADFESARAAASGEANGAVHVVDEAGGASFSASAEAIGGEPAGVGATDSTTTEPTMIGTATAEAEAVAPDDAASAMAVDADEPADRADEPAATTDPGAAPETATDDDGTFVAELVRAMQATAGQERARLGLATDQRLQAHVDAVRAREADEAERIRELAAGDQRSIEAWVAEETARIEAERERRTAALNADLETSLEQHRATIARELEEAEQAVAAYRTELNAFFDRLDHESDLVTIAGLAATRPAFPHLDPSGIRAVEPAADTTAATADAAAEPAGSDDVSGETGSTEAPGSPAPIGVMDPDASGETSQPWAVPVAAGAADEAPADEANQPEHVEATVVASSGKESLFHSVPVHRPMSFLRRHSGSDREG